MGNVDTIAGGVFSFLSERDHRMGRVSIEWGPDQDCSVRSGSGVYLDGVLVHKVVERNPSTPECFDFRVTLGYIPSSRFDSCLWLIFLLTKVIYHALVSRKESSLDMSHFNLSESTCPPSITHQMCQVISRKSFITITIPSLSTSASDRWPV